MMDTLTALDAGAQFTATILRDGERTAHDLEVYRVHDDVVQVTFPGKDVCLGKIREKELTGGREHTHVLVTMKPEHDNPDVVEVEV